MREAIQHLIVLLLPGTIAATIIAARICRLTPDDEQHSKGPME